MGGQMPNCCTYCFLCGSPTTDQINCVAPHQQFRSTKATRQQANISTSLQVKQQQSELNEDVQHLQNTPLIQNLNITPEEIVWAANAVTSRSFAGLKKLGMCS